MAVNNDAQDCQKPYGQPTNSGGDDDGAGLHRTRTGSPANGRLSPSIVNPYYTGRPRTPVSGSKSNTIDRQEIIRRIKNGESRPTSPELEKSNSADRQDMLRRIRCGQSRPTSPELEISSSGEFSRKRRSPVPFSTLYVAPDAQPRSLEVQEDNQSIGMQIERPRSALHRGDFREREQTRSSFERFATPRKEEPVVAYSTSPVVPWHLEFPASALRKPRHERQPLTQSEFELPVTQQPLRDRAVSNASLAASFTYKHPTSPLVQSSRPDTPEPPMREQSRSPDKSRRHTFSPQSFPHFKSALEYPSTTRASACQLPSLRAEKSFPYQAHQPRRSLNTTPIGSLAQTPPAASRRPSFSDSLLHHAPMIGSYEESILRGRMSTTPSRPLNFVAQIGVLGKGKCKSSLRCPPHVQVPFPAVFYSYGSGTKTPASDQPSPYVGLVDLENNLPNLEEVRDRRRQKTHGHFSNEGSRANSPKGTREDGSASDPPTKRRRRQKQKRRSGSPKTPPGGSYRIPQQGQVQIVIKNPNKTAVKLFLVPYDLTDMEPGQKTFVRQRSYSAGPIIDMPLSSRKNFGTDRPEAALSPTDDPNDRPTLRYLIHLHICCPAKGRYFLYKSVRIVFANRVPDGKEKLRNEIQLPEPRYSPYKPGRDSNVGVVGTGASKDGTRRPSHVDPADDLRWSLNSQHMAQSLPMGHCNAQYDIPIPSTPRHFSTLPTLESRPASRHFSDGMDIDSASQDTPSIRSPVSSNGEPPHRIFPRLADPFSFERDRSRERKPGARSESLLSKRLMDLAFQIQDNTRKEA